MAKNVVVISRRWGNPKIDISVTGEGISMEMNLTEFVESVASEMGNPTMLVTNKMLADKLKLAVNTVVAEMKDATKHAI